MMMLKNQNSFEETYRVSLQIIGRMQIGCTICEVKLMFKIRKRQILQQKDITTGPDLVHEFWLNNFSSLHESVRLQLNECLDSGFVPCWLTLVGRASLLQKDKSKCNVASNYRLITCLPLM